MIIQHGDKVHPEIALFLIQLSLQRSERCNVQGLFDMNNALEHCGRIRFGTQQIV